MVPTKSRPLDVLGGRVGLVQEYVQDDWHVMRGASIASTRSCTSVRCFAASGAAVGPTIAAAAAFVRNEAGTSTPVSDFDWPPS